MPPTIFNLNWKQTISVQSIRVLVGAVASWPRLSFEHSPTEKHPMDSHCNLFAELSAAFRTSPDTIPKHYLRKHTSRETPEIKIDQLCLLRFLFRRRKIWDITWWWMCVALPLSSYCGQTRPCEHRRLSCKSGAQLPWMPWMSEPLAHGAPGFARLRCGLHVMGSPSALE